MFRIITLFVLFMSGSAFGADNYGLREHCQGFADKNFQMRTTEDTLCLTYFKAIEDSGREKCFVLQYFEENGGWTEDQKRLIAKFAIGNSNNPNSLKELNASIQYYLNLMQKKPEQWGNAPVTAVRQSLQAIFPACR